MDTRGLIREHSKVKLTLYRLYLQRYLPVLLNSKGFNQIFVHDIFAGRGRSANNENGSPIIAAVEINKLKGNFKNKNIKLILNEKNNNNYQELENNVKPFSFISLHNMDANNYINHWQPDTFSHNLFFIDPHGYTQITIDNLKRLFSKEYCEFLIFVPVSHIYRFLRKEENVEQLEPIANFINDLGIGENEAKNINNIIEFSELILNALGKISNSEFVYKEDLESRDSNSRYSLFFITHHILGAEKFFDSQHKLKAEIEPEETQLAFDFVDGLGKYSIIKYISSGDSYNNAELYKLGIKNKFLPKELAYELKKLEKSGRIEVKPLPGEERNRKGFYINYNNYRDNKRIISITFKE